MAIHWTLPALIAACPITFGQSVTVPSGPYDDDGDPLDTASCGAPAPGDVLSTIQHPYFDTDGLAPYQGGLLVALGDGPFVYHVSATDGSELAVFPVAETSDQWLGYDAGRDLIITSNASSDRIKGFTPGSAVPVFDIPSPTPGPVGVAWDSARDEYVYCDWETDEVVVIDAVTLTVARQLAMPLTRMAGVAYDCIDDVYVVGDRDTTSHYTVDPMTGAIGISYPTAGTNTSSIPRGAALSDDSTVWTGDWLVNTLYEQEAGHPPIAGCAGIGTSYCLNTANSTGAPASISASGSASASANDFTLRAEPVPNQPGLFFFGQQQAQTPFGLGFLCIGAPVVRIEPPVVGAANVAERAVDLALFGIGPGTYQFQFWYRDPAAGGPAFNLSDGLEVVFAP